MKRKSKLFDMTKEELQQIYDESKSFNEIGKKTNTTNYETIKKVLKKNNIDITRLESPNYIKNNIKGSTFNYLTVLEVDDEKSKEGHGIYWKCQCKCGNIISASYHDLTHNKTTSCGCRGKELRRISKKKYNEYNLSGEYGVGYTTNTNKEFYFDKNDFNKIKDYAWRETANGYIETRTENHFLLLHKLILPCEKELEIDHINHNKLDNRKCNLRICTRQQNVWNRGILPSNKSGYPGVSQTKSCKWIARIKTNDKTIHLGTFEKYEDAINARKEAEIKYYGDFRYKGEDV